MLAATRCCTPCEVFDDDFNRADGNPSNGWTRTGTANGIVSNALKFVENGYLTRYETWPEGPRTRVNLSVGVEFVGGATSYAFLLWGFDDVADTYLAARIKFSGTGATCSEIQLGTLDLGYVFTATGSPTIITDTSATGTFTMCRDKSGRTVATYDGYSVEATIAHTPTEFTTANRFQYGLAAITDDSAGRDVIFDDYAASSCECSMPTGCDFVSDSFTRADSANLGCWWNVVSGSPSIVSNALVCDEDALAIHLTPHPKLRPSMHVQMAFELTDNSSSASVLLASTSDAADYLEVQCLRFADHIHVKLFDNNGTELADITYNMVLIPGDPFAFTLHGCYSRGQLSGYVEGLDSVAAFIDVTWNGWHAGWSVDFNSTNIPADTFLAVRTKNTDDPEDDCDECFGLTTSQCRACDTAFVAPTYATVTFQGVQDHQCGAQCPDMNTTFLVEFNFETLRPQDRYMYHCWWSSDKIVTVRNNGNLSAGDCRVCTDNILHTGNGTLEATIQLGLKPANQEGGVSPHTPACSHIPAPEPFYTLEVRVIHGASCDLQAGGTAGIGLGWSLFRGFPLPLGDRFYFDANRVDCDQLTEPVECAWNTNVMLLDCFGNIPFRDGFVPCDYTAANALVEFLWP